METVNKHFMNMLMSSTISYYNIIYFYIIDMKYFEVAILRRLPRLPGPEDGEDVITLLQMFKKTFASVLSMLNRAHLIPSKDKLPHISNQVHCTSTKKRTLTSF